MITIRNYNKTTDYTSVERLYKNSATFGGQFDEARDSQEKLDGLISQKPEAILVAEYDAEVVGTVTLFEDGRCAWLYRFAVLPDHEEEVTLALTSKAFEIMKKWGHSQVLVYAPADDLHFEERYMKLGFTKGNSFSAYWQNIV